MNKIIKTLKFTLTLAFGLIIALNAYSFDLRGTVTDTKGKAKKNVLVSVKHSDKQLKTDKEGRFNLAGVNMGDTIEIRSKEKVLYFPLRSESEISVTFGDENGIIEADGQTEQVAYKPIPKRRPSGVVTGEMIRDRNPQSLYEVLKLGLPGVQVVNEKVLIRGVNSFKSNVEPLFIINGAEYYSSKQANDVVQLKEIETVEVDREGGSYGAKGANGVIIIKYRSK